MNEIEVRIVLLLILVVSLFYFAYSIDVQNRERPAKCTEIRNNTVLIEAKVTINATIVPKIDAKPISKVETPDIIWPKETDREFLISVLIEQESRGRLNAIGDDGLAYGCLQIHQCVIDDVNRVYDTSYELLEVLGNVHLSKYICRKYWEIYASDDAGYEELARLWNGGPKWRKVSKTKKYWAEVQEIIKSRKHPLAA